MRVLDRGDTADTAEAMARGATTSRAASFSRLDGPRSEGMRGEGEDLGPTEEGRKRPQ